MKGTSFIGALGDRPLPAGVRCDGALGDRPLPGGGCDGALGAVRARYGKGEMLAFNCHPEIFADSHDIVVAGVRALTGRTVRLPPAKDPKGLVRVGFLTKDLGAKKGGVEACLKLAKDPSVYVVPLTEDEVREGYGAALDRIVAPEEGK